MAFWNSQKLLKQGETLFSPFFPDNVKSGAYEMRPRSKALVSAGDKASKEEAYDKIQIDPGQFALLITMEEVRVPPEAIGLISVKYSKKKEGLINVSGFHVDPGFHGCLKFSVYNASPRTIFIDPTESLFQIWLSDMPGEPDSYNGKHQGQQKFTTDDLKLMDGVFPSPPELQAKIEQLDKEVSTLKDLNHKLFIGIFIGLAITLVKVWLDNWLSIP